VFIEEWQLKNTKQEGKWNKSKYITNHNKDLNPIRIFLKTGREIFTRNLEPGKRKINDYGLNRSVNKI
jgi:hypothetical protein